MFDPEFFPTPHALALDLIRPYADRIASGELSSVLDPSAGKGDLLKAAWGSWGWPREMRLYAIERHPELRQALSGWVGKDGGGREDEGRIRVLGEDFESYMGTHLVDLVLMNPPFSVGAKHLLRACELFPGAEIACVLPERVLVTPKGHDEERVAAMVSERKLIAESKGQAFAVKAERRTDTRVMILRRDSIVQVAPAAFSATGWTANERVDEDVEDFRAQLAQVDVVDNVVAAFKAATVKMREVAMGWQEALLYLEAAGVPAGTCKDVAAELVSGKSTARSVNAGIDLAQDAAWSTIMLRSKVSELFTKRMHDEFAAFQRAQGARDFNRENIRLLVETLFQSRDAIRDQCVQDVFEKMCSYDKKNKVHFEGWKTNSAYKVNRKVIMPYLIEFTYGSFHVRYSGNGYTDLDDIDKAMCTVTGRSFGAISRTMTVLQEAFRGPGRDQPGEADSTFFQVRWFKKGTAHLVFLDDRVWEAFNIAAARGRGWLGEAA